MSTKTIAVDTRVYERLEGVRKKGESLSKVIDRLVDHVGAAHTGRDILRSLAAIPDLSCEDARVMLAVIAENRETETWDNG